MESAESSRCGASRGRWSRPRSLDRMTDAMTHRGPNDRGTYVGRRRRARRPAAQHRRRRGRPSAVRERGRARSGRCRTASSTTTTRCARELDAGGPPLPSRDATPRSSRTSTRTRGTAFAEQLRGMFGLAVWDGRERRARHRPRPARDQAALLRRGRRPARLRVGAEEPARERARRRSTLDYEAIDAYLTLGFVPGPRTPLAGGPQADARPPARRRRAGVRSRARTGSTRSRRPSTSQRWRRRTRAAARRARGVRAAAADERRPARRDAERRARLEPDRRADGAAHEPSRSRPSRSASPRPASGNELADARLVAEHFGTDHHELELSFADSDGRPRPSSSGTSTSRSPTSRRSGFSRSRELAAPHVTVALSGQGADELLGGYRKHRAAARRRRAGSDFRGPVRARGSARRSRTAPARFARAARTLLGAQIRRSGCSR